MLKKVATALAAALFVVCSGCTTSSASLATEQSSSASFQEARAAPKESIIDNSGYAASVSARTNSPAWKDTNKPAQSVETIEPVQPPRPVGPIDRGDKKGK